jgi:hypothetical protein
MKVGAGRDRVGAAVAAAGLEGLVAGQDVPGGDQDLAGDRGLGGVGLAVALGGVAVELVPGVGLAPGLLGGLDRRPAQRLRAGLGERAGARALAGLLELRGQAGVADQLARRREAGDVADLARDRQPEQRPDPGDRLEQRDARVGARERPQLALQRGEVRPRFCVRSGSD